ncbi:DUF3450 family protein [Candidatus Kuenenia sp.]|uniref:DUF3450 family protein n=1 Tax=Candidatus Kuenenia sp. TaxID=2499824 RepID=UPI00322050DD
MKNKKIYKCRRVKTIGGLLVKMHCRLRAAALLLIAFFMFAFITIPFETANGSVDSARAALEKWVETRRIISKEKLEFELAKEMLSERIELLGREIETVRKKNSEIEASITEADKKRAEMLEENEKLKKASTTLNATVIELETRTRELLKKLPDPIRGRVKPLSQRLSENQEDTKLSLGERFQNIIGILNEVNKFNGEISVVSEVHGLPDGNHVEATSLYIGIGQSYFVNGNCDKAGLGTASQDGWIWRPANEHAAAIAKAIAILKNETAAAFVQLPIEIQ